MSSDTGNNQENWPLYLAIILVIPVVDLLTGSNLPYGYFMLLRVLATAGFAYIAFQTYSFSEELFGIKYFLVFGAAAVLYNPVSDHICYERIAVINACINIIGGIFYTVMIAVPGSNKVPIVCSI